MLFRRITVPPNGPVLPAVALSAAAILLSSLVATAFAYSRSSDIVGEGGFIAFVMLLLKHDSTGTFLWFQAIVLWNSPWLEMIRPLKAGELNCVKELTNSVQTITEKEDEKKN